jgi:hypothetical protein
MKVGHGLAGGPAPRRKAPPARPEASEAPIPPRNTLAHACLNTPGCGSFGATSLGRKLPMSEFQVRIGAITRMRGS